jgi:hypothetical protein
MADAVSLGLWRRRTLLLVLVTLCAVAAAAVTWRDRLEFELGYAYESGNFHGWTHGFSKDHAKAAYWLKAAASAGHPRAQYMFGILCAHGWGVPRDAHLAVRWFSRAARSGYGPALYHLGWMYHKGDDVPRDYGRSMQLMARAAGQGMAAACLALGRFYERGEGTEVNLVQALKWDTLAIHFCRTRPRLHQNAAFSAKAQAARDDLMMRMSSSQVAKSGEFARAWLSHSGTEP